MRPHEIIGAIPLISIILVSGFVGGVCSAIREAKASKAPWCDFIVIRVLEGVIASATVPLFLSFIGSSDVSTILSKPDFYDYSFELAAFRVLGFALIAALSAQRFLDTVTSRVFNLEREVKGVTERVQQAESKVSNLADVVIESENPQPALSSGASPTGLLPEDVDLTGRRQAALAAFFEANLPARSTGGIALSMGATIIEAQENLEQLQRLGLVRAVETFRGERWTLTPQGRESIAALNKKE